MKNINKILASLGVLMLLLAVTSCSDNEVEPLFDQTVNERAEAFKEEYSNILTSADNGWIGYYTPNEDFGIYNMLLDFDPNGGVSVDSDFEAGAQNKAITYRIDKTLKVELVFESSSVFSEIFAVNNNNNQGEFVFNILSANEDEVVLESKLDFGDDVTVFSLRRATAEDLDFQPIYDIINHLIGGQFDSGVREVLLNGEVIAELSFDENSRSITLTYEENEEIITEEVRVFLTRTGFMLEDPLTINGAVLSSFNFDEPSDSYVEKDNTNLIIGDFIVCPIDIDSFVGTYSVNEGFYAGTNAGLVLANYFGENYQMEIALDPTDVSGRKVLISNADGYDTYLFNNTTMTFSTCDETVSFDDDVAIALWQYLVVVSTYYDEVTHTIVVQGDLGPYGPYQFILTKQ